MVATHTALRLRVAPHTALRLLLSRFPQSEPVSSSSPTLRSTSLRLCGVISASRVLPLRGCSRNYVSLYWGLSPHRLSSSHRLIVSSSHRLIAFHRFIVSSPHRLIVSSSHRLIASSPHRFIASSPFIAKKGRSPTAMPFVNRKSQIFNRGDSGPTDRSTCCSCSCTRTRCSSPSSGRRRCRCCTP